MLKYYINRLKKRVSTDISLLSLRNAKVLRKYLFLHAWRLFTVSTGKLQVSARLRRFNKFLDLLLKVYRHHGMSYVIKWLKASHLAVQRKLSSKPMTSLREIEPDLPLPGLINGLPKFIGTVDRRAIRSGHPGTIRLWLTILSLYRVLRGPYKLKLSTITDPWKGDKVVLKQALSEIADIVKFNKMVRDVDALKATSVIRSVASGPNCKVAYLAFVTDAYAMLLETPVYKAFCNFAIQTGSDEFLLLLRKTMAFAERSVIKYGFNVLNTSHSVSRAEALRTGKLAFKLEPAGKVRVFAIIDIWTQSLLAPLHKDLFSMLRGLPNDGTFDQDASFERCISKAKLYNCAYAFDLSSATDRLPVSLQAGVINLIYNHPFLGDFWKDLLVNRRFIVRSTMFPDYQGEDYLYATGQPMGGLSSWAMLAVTHHLIMQSCAFRVYGTRKWYDKYEILGDDIVIFDHAVAMEYLALMGALDVGINLSKSLTSDALQTLEFAKRTAVGGIDVSGLSWKQLLSGNNSQGRVNFALAMVRKGLVTSVSMLVKAMLSCRYVSPREAMMSDHYRPILERDIFSILGSFAFNGKVPLESLVTFMIDPSEEGDRLWGKLPDKLPLLMMLRSVIELAKCQEPLSILPKVISSFDKRLEMVRGDMTLSVLSENLVSILIARWSTFLKKENDLFALYTSKLVNRPEGVDTKFVDDLLYFSKEFVYQHRYSGEISWLIDSMLSLYQDKSYPLEQVLAVSQEADLFISRLDYVSKPNDFENTSVIPKLLHDLIDAENSISMERQWFYGSDPNDLFNPYGRDNR